MSGPSAVTVFRRGSRTYFHASLFFPSHVRRDVSALYAFVRTADDFVDRVPQDASGFEAFVERCRAAMGGEVTGDEVVDAFAELSVRRGFDPAWTEAFLAAMRSDLAVRSYETLDDLVGYMYGSAEVIGLYMARLLDLPPESHPAAQRLGRAMQYVNFLRDVGQDRALGRVYVPRAVLARHGVDRLDAGTAAARPADFDDLVRSELDRYRRWQAQAEEGYHFLPTRARVAIRTAADMYAWTADRICERPRVVLERSVKPSAARIVLRLLRNGVAELVPGRPVWHRAVNRIRAWIG